MTVRTREGRGLGARLLGHVLELAKTPYYRTRPVAAISFSYAKWQLARYRVDRPEQLLQDLGILPSEAFAGFERWRSELNAAVSAAFRDDEHHGAITMDDGLFLYGLVRALKPSFLVETGVAGGISTSFIGAALIDNDYGNLYSIELPPDKSGGRRHDDGATFDWPARGVGWAIPPSIQEGLGDRHVLVLDDVRRALPRLLRQLPRVDFFFHDDLHVPNHMLWEFRLVWEFLAPGGVLVSDDVNYGWIRFIREQSLPTIALRNMARCAAVRKPRETTP